MTRKEIIEMITLDANYEYEKVGYAPGTTLAEVAFSCAIDELIKANEDYDKLVRLCARMTAERNAALRMLPEGTLYQIKEQLKG